MGAKAQMPRDSIVAQILGVGVGTIFAIRWCSAAN
jgi:hypothetical protein